MSDLLLSIVFSALLFVILRLFPVWKVITFNGIVINYFTAATWAFMFSDGWRSDMFTTWSFLPVVVLTGAMFIVVFFITGLTTQRTGVAVASVASKMSMVIPVAAGLFLYNENLGWFKALGILLALPAVFLVSRPASPEAVSRFRIQDLGLPVLLFVGAGMVDTMIKMVQHFYMTPDNRSLIIMMIFFMAGLIGLTRAVWLASRGHKFITVRDGIGGIMLGSANFLSLHFLVRCLEIPGTESSQVFTLVNTGVVTMSALIAAVVFKEPFNISRSVGVLLALVSILVLSL